MTTLSPTGPELASPLTALRVHSAGVAPRLIFVEHDEFTIGAGEACDLFLPDDDMPRVHSLLRLQGSVIWIEAVHDAAVIAVNDATFRRRALRDGDVLMFGETEATVHIGEKSVQAAELMTRAPWESEDLLLLSAEELCDRIEQEESRALEFDRRRRLGWRALMTAVQDVIEHGTGATHPGVGSMPAVAAVSDEKLDELVTQVRDLSETLDERTKTLAAQEAVLIESSSQLCEAQLRVSRQLEQLLERITPEDNQAGELRVSA